MKDRSEINRSIGGTKCGSSLKDLDEGDLGRGYYDAAPEGNYEGSLDGDTYFEMKDDKLIERHMGTKHAGHIEPDGYRGSHGEHAEYGFVRRPTRGGDVERN